MKVRFSKLIAPFLIILSLLLLPLTDFFNVFALPGDLDNSFNSDGEFLIEGSDGGKTDVPTAVFVDSNNEVYIAGKALDSSYQTKMALWKLTEDGDLDTSFSTDGIIIESGITGGTYDEGFGVVVDSTGDVILMGESRNTFRYLAMARYNSDGTLDTAFGTSGYYDSVSDGQMQPQGMTIDSNDNIYVVGKYAGAASVWKFDRDGDLDTTFGGSGTYGIDGVTYDYGLGTTESYGYDITVDSTGKILVVGKSYNTSQSKWEMTVWRFESDGDLDTTFDSDGVMSYYYNDSSIIGQTISGITVDTDDEPVITGYLLYTGGQNTDAFTWKLEDNGSFDTSYDLDGRQLVGYSTSDGNLRGSSVLVDEDGNYVISTTEYGFSPTTRSIKVVRYLTDGSLDTDFSGDGIAVALDAAPVGELIGGDILAIDNKNRLVVTGTSRAPNWSTAMTTWRLRGGEILSESIDIRPGECENLVDVDSTGIISVAINGSSTFDVTTVDTNTITFDGATPVQTFVVDMSDSADCDGINDTYDDLIVRVRISDLQSDLQSLTSGASASLDLYGDLSTGDSIKGTGSIEVLNN